MTLSPPLFTQTGHVIPGSTEARTLGFPTLNIVLQATGLAAGTYAGIVMVAGKKYQAAVYVNVERKILEAHLLDFSDDVYGQAVTLQLFKFIIPSKQFTNQTEQQKFIEAAVQSVREYFTHVF